MSGGRLRRAHRLEPKLEREALSGLLSPEKGERTTRCQEPERERARCRMSDIQVGRGAVGGISLLEGGEGGDAERTAWRCRYGGSRSPHNPAEREVLQSGRIGVPTTSEGAGAPRAPPSLRSIRGLKDPEEGGLQEPD